MALDDVAARISSIQARFSVMAPRPAAPTTAAAFGQAMAAASAGTDPAAASGAVGDLGLTAAGGSSDGGVSGDDVVTDASQYLGVPYVWGGTDPATGLDCSGLVQRTYADLGIDMPRVAADQARMGQPVGSLADAKPGDLVAFGSPVDHIGIYAGNNKMVVAPHHNDVVKIEDITVPPTAIRRIIPDGGLPSGLGSGAVAGMAGAGTAAGGPASLTSFSGALADTPYRDLFASAGARYGVDPRLLSAVARAESGYNANAVSGAGAQGLMQLMPSTARGLGVDPRDPAQAVDGAARLLAGNLRRFGSVDLAVAAYNAGGGAVSRYGGIPPFPETQGYVRRVLSYAGAQNA